MTDPKKSEYEMIPFFEMTPDLVCIASKEGFFKKVNQTVFTKLEFSPEELFSRPISSFMHPDDREMTAREREKLFDGKAMINFQNRYITKTGKIIWLDWTSIYFPEQEVVFAIAKDVTERKAIEKEIEEKYIKFKSLASHFKTSIEKDRKFLAVELHEELAQLAAVVKMDVAWIGHNTPNLSDESKSRIEHAMAVSDLIINGIRRISFSISPNMLDDLGLNETLKWLSEEFSDLNGVPCNFTSALNEENLTHEMKLDFFRICQESLTNIMYHAQAKNVKITVEETDGKICLSIVDDGKGFCPEELNHISGLTSMRERASSINGQLKIESEIGKGTRISITIARHMNERESGLFIK